MGMKFKINTGYGAERHISIDEDELEKAYGLFLLGGRAIFRGGAVDSKVMQDIVPDYHAEMGWNREYKLGPDDFAELSAKGIDQRALTLQNKTQERVQYLVAQDKTDLIGKNVPLPELDKPRNENRGEGMKRIGQALN